MANDGASRAGHDRGRRRVPAGHAGRRGGAIHRIRSHWRRSPSCRIAGPAGRRRGGAPAVPVGISQRRRSRQCHNQRAPLVCRDRSRAAACPDPDVRRRAGVRGDGPTGCTPGDRGDLPRSRAVHRQGRATRAVCHFVRRGASCSRRLPDPGAPFRVAPPRRPFGDGGHDPDWLVHRLRGRGGDQCRHHASRYARRDRDPARGLLRRAPHLLHCVPMAVLSDQPGSSTRTIS